MELLPAEGGRHAEGGMPQEAEDRTGHIAGVGKTGRTAAACAFLLASYLAYLTRSPYLRPFKKLLKSCVLLKSAQQEAS